MRQQPLPSTDKPPWLLGHYWWCRDADSLLNVQLLCNALNGESDCLQHWMVFNRTCFRDKAKIWMRCCSAHALNSPFSLGEAQVIGREEATSLSLTGGVGGSLSRICSGTRSLRVMRGGGGTWCRLQGLRGDERLCKRIIALSSNSSSCMWLILCCVDFQWHAKNRTARWTWKTLYQQHHSEHVVMLVFMRQELLLTHLFHFSKHIQPLTKWHRKFC